MNRMTRIEIRPDYPVHPVKVRNFGAARMAALPGSPPLPRGDQPLVLAQQLILRQAEVDRHAERLLAGHAGRVIDLVAVALGIEEVDAERVPVRHLALDVDAALVEQAMEPLEHLDRV